MVTSRGRELGPSGDSPVKPAAGEASPGGAEGDARAVGACSGFPQPCLTEGRLQ